jgi:RHS repeat-associated protein
MYMQARYYDPVIGRFYSNDPVGTLGHLYDGNVQGFNRYAYANNNPYKYTDPDGRTPVHAVAFGIRACASNAACSRAAVAGGRAVVNGATRAYNAVSSLLSGVFNESAEDVTDRSGQEGTSEEVDGFVDDLDGISSPQSDDKNIRILKPGVSVDDLKSKAPGSDNGRGRNKTQEGGNIGTHESTTTTNSDGTNSKTLDVHRPKGSANKKYRENN